MGMGLEILTEMRNKISKAAQAGKAGIKPPAMLLGQYESYFEEPNLRKLPPETLSQLARSLGIDHPAAAAIHRRATKRFKEIRDSSALIPTLAPAEGFEDLDLWQQACR